MSDAALEIPADYRGDDELNDLQNSDDVNKLRSLLNENEQVYRIIVCMNDGSDGVLAATDQRLLYCDKRFLSSDIVSMKYEEVAAIVSQTELMTIKLALVGIDFALYLDGIDKTHGARFLEYTQDYIGQNYESHGRSGRHLRHTGEILQMNDLPKSSDFETV
jgi:hypothetical protein